MARRERSAFFASDTLLINKKTTDRINFAKKDSSDNELKTARCEKARL